MVEFRSQKNYLGIVLMDLNNQKKDLLKNFGGAMSWYLHSQAKNGFSRQLKNFSLVKNRTKRFQNLDRCY